MGNNKKTTGFTVTAGEGYFCDTSSGGFVVTLPAGTAGNSFAVADYTNTFNTGNLTIRPNGSQKIGGIENDATLSTKGQSAYFVYVDDTEGWKNVIDSTSNIIGTPPFISATGGTETESGNCKIHTFTGPGTFTVTTAATCAANNVVSHIVVAGGGGAARDRGGGGGAGGFREVVSPSSPYSGSPLDGYPSAPNRVTVSAQAYPITVGAGGSGGPTASPPGCSGRGSAGNPSIFSTITSAGGGQSGPGDSPVPARHGAPGGSGGGGGAGNDAGGIAGTGNTPPTTPAQGTNGGASTGAPATADRLGAGGGGATVAGTNGAPGGNGNGGAGATTSITGSPTTYAGGGGGGRPTGTAGTGGSGGGGAGSNSSSTGTAGTANTGGGGGGGGTDTSCGGAGGSGIVIIRYRFQ